MSLPDLRNRALRFLARREYSTHELKQRLSGDATDAEIDEVLLELEKENLLSDERFVEQILHARTGKYGRRKIVQELQEKGIGHDLIAKALSEMEESEFQTLHAIWKKKFGRQPESLKEKATQVRFLQSRGFDLDKILKVIKDFESE